MVQTKALETTKQTFEKSSCLKDNVEKFVIAGQATVDNIEHAGYVRLQTQTQTHTRTHRIIRGIAF